MNIQARFSTPNRSILPDFAKSIETFRETGEFPADSDRLDLTRKEAQWQLDSSRAQIKQFKALDEGPHDLRKGAIGEVKVAGSNPGEFTEAQFREEGGTTELLVHRNLPSQRFGATSAEFHRLSSKELDVVHVTNNNGVLLHSSLSHVEYQLATDKPVQLGKDPVSVVLTPQATSGYHLSQTENPQ